MATFTCNFNSYTLKQPVDIKVIIPTMQISSDMKKGLTHKVKGKFKVLYLLHGMFGDYNSWIDLSNISRYAEEFNIAIVTFNAHNNFYFDLNDFYKAENFSRLEPLNYQSFLREELRDFISSMFAISKKREDSFIAGLSMGGYGSLVNGLTLPLIYKGIGSFSPLTTIKSYTNDKKVLRKYEPIILLDNLLKRGKELPDIYYSYGDKDFLKEMQDDFRDNLNKRNVKYTLDEDPEYGHQWKFWDKQVYKYLKHIHENLV